MFKRIFLFIIILIILIIFFPVLLIISVLIKIDSKGSIIFKQKRVGLNGNIFKLYKFRTMKIDVDPYGQSPQEEDDPRITRIGKFLRETSLDELPQLINVLKGEMNLVGPRPLLPWQKEKFTDYEAKRLNVKPGITGLAQINGRGNLTWEEKIEYDLEYVKNKSFWLDMKIIFITIKNIFIKKDIYESDEGAWKDD